MSDQYYEDRLRHLTDVAGLGIDPYGARFPDVATNETARQRAEALNLAPGQTDESARIRIAGRTHLRRVMGKLAFLTLRDSTGDLQVGVSKAKVGDSAWSMLEVLDLGDILGVDGALGKTKTGEITVWAQSLTLL